ncbi:MAG: hypothetical protein RJA44_1820, partial [Pseudomonadota bacterium]
MAIYNGTIDAELLSGGSGNDTLNGLAGNDTLDGGLGTNLLQGGLGDDTYIVNSAADVIVEAGAEGEDTVFTSISWTLGLGNNVENIFLTGTGNVNAIGNELGNTLTGNAGANVLSGGDGADTIDATGGGADTISGGSGSDLIVLTLDSPLMTITDFSTGAGGDKLDLGTILDTLATYNDYDYRNPFTSGHLRLVASGTDTLLQVDRNGGATAGEWLDVVLLKNTTPAAFTSDNFRYHLGQIANTTPVLQNATSLDGELIEGWDGNDTLLGADGNDRLDGGFGGNDSLSGGLGNDTLLGYSGNDVLDGGDGGDYLRGGSGNDVIRGGAGDDQSGKFHYKGTYYVYDQGIYGEAGNDTIDGGDGSDYISGGSGDDSVVGGSGALDGADRLTDESGFDTLRGGEGNDTLTDLNGGGQLYGEAGDDQLEMYGSAAPSMLDGGAGNDSILLAASAGRSTVLGGLGNDSITLSSSTLDQLVVDGGDGNDIITNGGRANSAWVLNGGAGDDRIEIGGQFHLINAGSGNDTIDFQVDAYHTGTGIVTTGAGSDTIELSVAAVLDGRVAPVITDFSAGAGGDRFDLSSVNASLGLAPGANPFASGLLRLEASGSNTYIEFDRTATGGSGGYETLAILQGVSPASLTAANFVQSVGVLPVSSNKGPQVELPRILQLTQDTPTALKIAVPTDAEGSVTVYIREVPQGGILTLADGTTQVYANSSYPIALSDLAGLIYHPDAGVSGLQANQLSYTVIDSAGSRISSAIAFEVMSGLTLNGTAGNDYLLGQAGNDLLSGGDGSDYLSGGAGADTMVGGLGNDTYVVESAGDVVTEAAGAGTDTVQSYISYTLGANVENLTLTGTAAINGTGNELNNSLNGNAANNVLVGAEGNDTLIGWGGNDTMSGGVGNDLYVVQQVGDVVIESAGAGTDVVQSALQSYTLGANVENLVLITGGANGSGNELGNVLTGNAASNVLVGWGGNDTMSGGVGNDLYVVQQDGDVVIESAG